MSALKSGTMQPRRSCASVLFSGYRLNVELLVPVFMPDMSPMVLVVVSVLELRTQRSKDITKDH